MWGRKPPLIPKGRSFSENRGIENPLETKETAYEKTNARTRGSQTLPGEMLARPSL